MLNYGNTTNKDSSEFIGTVITGAQSDQASAMVGFNYYRRNAIYNRDRSYSQIPPFLSTNSSPLNLEVTRAAAVAAGIPASSIPGTGNTVFVASPATSSNAGETPASGYTVSATRPSVFNFNEFSMSYPERDNRGIFAYADRKIFGTDNIRGYVDVTYQNANTENQLAPTATGSFTVAGQTELVIPSRTATPLPLSNTRPRAAVAGAFNPFNPFNVDITGGTRARLAEFGNRVFRNATDAALLTAGIRGDQIAGKWNFDAGYSYSAVRSTARDTLVSATRFNRLLNANDPFFQPGSPEYLGTTTPYNPFGYYKVPIPNNQQIVGAALIDRKDVNESKLNQVNAVISTANLFEMPSGGVGFALGADARHEQLDQFPDPYGATGDLIGESPKATTHGHRKVWGAFAEANIPIFKYLPGAHDLTATAAVRHEDFTTHDQTTTVPKFGVKWQPVDASLTVRGSWSKGFREPSLYEMYSSPTASLFPITHPTQIDPATGRNAFEPEQAVTVAGNRRLAPEKTEYLNTGVVWSPQFTSLKGLTLSVDYWEADRTGTVTNNYQDTINRYFGHSPTGEAAPGGLLPGESVVLNADGSINVINSVFFNIGRTKVAGFDYSLSYLAQMHDYGRVEFSTVWSQYTHYLQRTTTEGPFKELAKQDTQESTGAVNGYLRWKGRAQIEWAHRGFTTIFGGNYTDGFWDVDPDGNTFMIKSTWIYDAQVAYSFGNRSSAWLADTKVALGVRNVFDKDPPYAAAAGGNSTGYPSFLYSSEGRFLYVQLNRRF